jgi:hypothetical protein
LKYPVALLCFLATGSAIAQRPEVPETKNELVVFGGVSILDAEVSSESALPGVGDIPGRPDFPFFPDFPGGFPDITVRSRTELGSSVLFGARYSRRIKDRLAVEGDLAIAPTHDLELEGDVCLDGFGCFGEGGMRGGPFSLDFFQRGVTAWHYGGGLTYDVTEGDVRPFVLVGAGGVTWDGASETDFVFRFGGGLKVLFGNLGVRVDVADHLVLDHFLTSDNEHDVHATAGFLVRF